MKSSAEIVAYVAERILHISLRPLMYEVPAENVERELALLYELWSFATENLDRLRDEQKLIYRHEGTKTWWLSEDYRAAHPDASENDVAHYVANQWYKVGLRLGVELPFASCRKAYCVLRNTENTNGILNTALFDELDASR